MRTPLRRRNGHEVEQRAAEPADRGHQDAHRSAHQRYYTVISRAVTEQGETTFSSREAVYERARAAQASALEKYHPSLTKDNFDRERLALEQAIDRVEQESASSLWWRSPPNQYLSSTSKRLHRWLSKIGKGLFISFVLIALVLSPRIFVEGVWITDTAVSYLVWSINMITRTEHQPARATYQIIFSDGVAQEIRLFPDEIERWIRMSNIANATKHYQIVRAIDAQGRIVWGQ